MSLGLAKEIHYYVLLFQRRMRKVRFDYDFPLDNDSMLLLMLLATEKEITATEVAKILVLQKTKVSRELFKLEQAGYIESISSKEDRRTKLLKYTKAGRDLVNELKRINNDISIRGIYPIKAKKREVFVKFFTQLSDALGFEKAEPNPGELPLWNQQRRIASHSGMVGNEYMSSGLQLLEYQIFIELIKVDADLRFSHFVEKLPFEASKMSRSISAFEKKGYMAKKANKTDKRGINVRITKKGQDFFSEINDKVAKRYLEALISIDKKIAKEFIASMKTLDDVNLPPPTPREITLSVCSTEDDFKLARKILVELLVKASRHNVLTSKLIPENFFCVNYRVASTTIGVLTISRDKGSDISSVINFEISLPSDLKHLSMEQCLKLGLAKYNKKSVNLPTNIQDRLSLPPEIQLTASKAPQGF